MTHPKDIHVSRLNSVFDTRPRAYPLRVLFKEIRQGNATLANLAEDAPYRTLAQVTQRARELRYEHGNQGAYELLKREMPQFTPAAVLSARSEIQSFSELACLEWDGDVDTDHALMLGKQHPSVLAIWRSLSEKPKFLIPISPISKDGDALTRDTFKHAWFDAFLLFEDIGEADLTAMDPTHLQALCYDPDLHVNWDAIPVEWTIDDETFAEAYPNLTEVENVAYAELPVEYHIAIQEMVWKPDGWGETSVPCPFGGNHEHDGWGSRANGTGIHKNGENDYTFHCLKCPKSKRYSENPTRPKAKLKHNADTEPEPTETRDENRANREAAADTFFTEPVGKDTLHIILVKDSTGSGKTYTIILKAQRHGKRSLAQLPHTELAKQAVNIAWELGYKNPCHLTGREHNWKDSGIEQIPPAERTKDLFSKNNCLMVDVLQEYTEKRVAPRVYCYQKCPFVGVRDTESGEIHLQCPHLLQYEGLGDRDFIATCTPNLLFDVDMRGYLQSLVSATYDPSDEDFAMDAILGTESEATDAFDFAIVDDYGVNALYSDKSFRKSEFKKLKKVWHGTPTATFAKLMLKAFEKKKPHKIVKALRNAFENTAEHHAEIAEALTQHARTGIVETPEISLHSKETERLLTEKQVSYADGGRQFIPVSYDAYYELDEKEIPVIHPKDIDIYVPVGDQVRIPLTPTQALKAGVPIGKLTPVWQNGATPIELLQIFLDSIGNDENSPLNRTFTAGDPPDCVLNFSVPPQAPVGILDKIAMLSATNLPEDVQQPFDGQPVTFSVHEGGNLDHADGVQIYQFAEARLTSASVFEYPKDANGKRKLQEAPAALTPTAEERLKKLNDWAKAEDGNLTAFISYKEFTDAPFSEAVNSFDVVTHFDKVAGLNFDGLKFLVVFGYPKVKHEVVMEHARKQYASDTEPLPTGSYDELTETTEYTENGLTITESRYLDPRLEKIRHQLSTEKLDQALGRARFSVWTDTITIAFTNAPIAGITERATLFSSDAFNLANSPKEILEAMEKIRKAEESGDVQEVMETKGVSERTARRQTKNVRDQQNTERDAAVIKLHKEGVSLRKIHARLRDTYDVSFGTISNIVKAYKNGQRQL